MKLNKTFKVAEAPESTTFDVLPAGDYVVTVTESEMKPTKKSGGEYLMLTLEVLEGAHKGRRLWSRLNLVNENTTAVEIAERQLADLCRAVGKEEVEDSEDLHDTPVVAVVKVRPADREYSESNDVIAFKSVRTASGAVSATKSEEPWKETATSEAPF